MRKAILYFLFIIGFSLIFPQFTLANEEDTYIVLFQIEIDEQLIETSGATLVKTLKNSPVAVIQADELVIDKLKQNKKIRSIEADKEVKITAQKTNWGMKPTKIPTAWDSGYTGKGVKIAVVDSGIGPHEDIKVVESISFLPSGSSLDDENGHGTHVAGIIGALDNDIGVKGVAPDAELYALKVFNKQGIGLTSDIIRAIDWSIEHDMDIVNLSLTSKVGLRAYEEVINSAYAKGILIVAAAGNATTTDINADTVEYPARYRNAIAVASINEERNKGFLSAIGPSVEIAAPGENIYSTYAQNGYLSLSGTSLATAFVTGQFALLKEAYPSLNNVQLRKKLIDDAKDLGIPGHDPIFGYGLIQSNRYDMPLFEFPAKNNRAIKFTFTKDSVSGEVGQTVQVNALAQLKNGQIVDVSDFARWTSAHPAVATSRSGRIDLHEEGKTIFHISYDGLKADFPVEVRKSTTSAPINKSFFKDIPDDHWAKEEIHMIYNKLIITGYEDQTFRPKNKIQRQHVAAMLARTIQLEKKRAIDPFIDIKMDSPYFYDIMKTQQADIFSGDNKRFNPYSDLTRVQMAKVLVLAFDLPKTSTHPFPDISKDHWANEYVGALYAAGITTGSHGLFKPERPVTRAEFAIFIKRALDYRDNARK